MPQGAAAVLMLRDSAGKWWMLTIHRYRLGVWHR